MKIRSITTKFIVLLSILMAFILAIQLYFNNQMQQDILIELNTLKKTINTTTDQILIERFESGETQSALPKDSLIWNSKVLKEHLKNKALKKVTINRKGYSSSVNYGFEHDSVIWDFDDHEELVVGDKKFIYNKMFKKSKDGDVEIIEINLNDGIINKKVETLLTKVKEVRKSSSEKNADDNLLVFEFPNLITSNPLSKVRYNYSTSFFNENLEKIQYRNFWITLILFGISLIAITIITAKFLKPIKSLNNSFDKVVQGDLDVFVESRSKDEIGELSASFNHMVNELSKNKNKESLMQRQERLASLGQLAAGVAHEIKNPLNAINLTIEHLQDKFIKENEKQATSYINTIQKEIHRLDKTANNLLSYLRSENLKKRNMDVNILLDDILNLYEREIAANKIVLVKEYDTRCILKIDEERFKTVVMNIVLNAIQAMENGGKITITTDQKNKEVIIRDTGKGIPAKHLKHIFDLFYTTKSAGSGLGLPTAYKIMQEHGGDIFIDSVEGEGTLVKIIL